MRINKDDFDLWRQHRITEMLFKFLDGYREILNGSLLNVNLLLEENNGKKIAELVGEKIMCEMLLNLEYDQLAEDNDNE